MKTKLKGVLEEKKMDEKKKTPSWYDLKMKQRAEDPIYAYAGIMKCAGEFYLRLCGLGNVSELEPKKAASCLESMKSDGSASPSVHDVIKALRVYKEEGGAPYVGEMADKMEEAVKGLESLFLSF